MTASSSWFVPGRIEVLGKHTDYAGGRSLLCAVDLGHTVRATARSDRKLHVTSALSPDAVELDLEDLGSATAAPGHWSGYVRTVAARLEANFRGMIPGADVTVESTLPPAAGMSSSSALVVGLAQVLLDLGEIRETGRYQRAIPDDDRLAEYLGTVENGQSFGDLAGDRGVGTFGGSEDHTAMLCSREGSLVQYSFCPVRHEATVPLPAGHVLVVAVSGVEAHKTGAALEDYNRCSLSAAEALRRWNVAEARADRTLADALATSPKAARRIRELLAGDTDLLARFEQFDTESQRLIPAAVLALEEGDLEELGMIVDESQRGSEVGLRNQVPETIALQREARDLGAVAASAFGAGFGGSVWALVPAAEAEVFSDRWRDRYLRAFPSHRGAVKVVVAQAGPPAHRLGDR